MIEYEFPRDPAEYRFVIPGACPPKGSRVPVRKGSDKTREASKRVEPWTTGAVRSMRNPLGKPLASFSGPVYVAPVFYFERPKVTEFPFPTATTIGDVDKLVRCLLDALTKAGVIEDDRFVVDLIRPRKRWAGTDLTVVEVGAVRLPEFEMHDVTGIQGRRYEADSVHPRRYETVPGGLRVPNPYAELPPPPPEPEFIPMIYDGKHDRLIGPTDYGLCPKCERAALKPRDNAAGVECSSTSCDYWFCY